MASRSALVAALVAGLHVAALSAQLPGPAPRDKQPPSLHPTQERRFPLTVSGCVRGNRLRLLQWPGDRNGTAEVFHADEFILEGPRDLMRQLRKDHHGHRDELTGVAILRPVLDGSSTTEVESKPLGERTTVTLGAHESGGQGTEMRQPVRFRVTSVRHLHDTCGAF